MIPQQSATKSERGQVTHQHHGFVSLNPKALFASSCIEQALEVPWHTVVLAGARSERAESLEASQNIDEQRTGAPRIE